MKKILALVLAGIMLFSFAACGGNSDNTEDTTAAPVNAEVDSDLEYIKNKGTLIVGITDYAPMDYKEPGSDEWTGFDAEFARAVAAEWGVEVQFIEIDWDSKIYELNAKTIDCVWNGMTITDEIIAAAEVSDAYVKNAQVVVMDKAKLADYATAESLADLTFAAEAGSAGEKEVKAMNVEYTAVQTQADALREVKSGAADACVIDITMANAMTGEGTSYADLGYTLELSTEEYGIAFRKGSDAVASVNELMDKFTVNGTLTALAEKYELTLA